MDELYVMDNKGSFIPIRFDVAAPKDLDNKLIVITVGSNNEPATNETLEYVQKYFKNSKSIIDSMRRSGSSNLLILPHTIKLELVSKEDIDKKTICVQIESSDDISNFEELKHQIKTSVRKDVVVLPSPISIKEYKEVKEIQQRLKIRKNRNGGGLNKARQP